MMNARARILTATALLAALAASPVMAGDGNQLSIKQDSSLAIGAKPNTLRVDQSNASNSRVGGPTSNSLALEPLEPSNVDDNALQIGSGNQGDITIEGDRGVVSFVQSGNGSAVGTNNIATVNLGAGATLAAIEQLGTGNNANLDVSGNGSDGSIFQQGLNNQATLTVTDGASGTINQRNNNNSANLVVGGTPDAAVTLNQNGGRTFDSENPSVNSPAIQVFTNTTGVTITQSN